MASHDNNAKGRLQTYKNQGKDVDVSRVTHSYQFAFPNRSELFYR